ncbi:MAG: Holliday junction branch migration protein RuvA [Acetobacteraceae bacterium]|nr:Holliday junction branch migration protein RuvA [Acetobacteraceae bacterium]MDW8398389.1 Holliday junction branch migration protein RuvA [Acetobacteraceae bacterium]
MIGRLTGRPAEITETGCILDVNGVGYLLSCSTATLAALRDTQGPVTLLVETEVRQDAILLAGFLSATERDAFRKLTTIQQVGRRVALDILSALPPERLAAAVRAGDKAALRAVPGVGPKLVERLLTELKSWAGTIGSDAAGPAAPAAAPAGQGVAADAISALANLGLRGAQAQAAVSRAVARLGEGAQVEAVIREALRELAPR